MVATIARRGDGRHGRVLHGCRQPRRSAPAPESRLAVRGAAVAQAAELHVHRGGFGVARSLVLDDELLGHRGEELEAGLLLSRLDEDRAADLVEDGRQCSARRTDR